MYRRHCVLHEAALLMPKKDFQVIKVGLILQEASLSAIISSEILEGLA